MELKPGGWDNSRKTLGQRRGGGICVWCAVAYQCIIICPNPGFATTIGEFYLAWDYRIATYIEREKPSRADLVLGEYIMLLAMFFYITAYADIWIKDWAWLPNWQDTSIRRHYIPSASHLCRIDPRALGTKD